MYTVENIQHTFNQSNSHRYEIIAPNIYLDSYSSMDIDSLVNISRSLSDKSFSNEYGQTLFEK